MARGDIVLVPFPFTDLTGQKRRPALVVSPEGFDPQDLILCAITSRIPGRPIAWDVPLDATDLVIGALPRPSVIKVGKLFTMHRALVFGLFGQVQPQKIEQVLATLQRLFGH